MFCSFFYFFIFFYKFFASLSFVRALRFTRRARAFWPMMSPVLTPPFLALVALFVRSCSCFSGAPPRTLFAAPRSPPLPRSLPLPPCAVYLSRHPSLSLFCHSARAQTTPASSATPRVRPRVRPSRDLWPRRLLRSGRVSQHMPAPLCN